MRYLLAAIIAVGLGWAGYWYLGASQTERAVRTWLDDRSAEGWVANYESVKTIGFPNRFDTTITAPELADPDTGLAWRAPFWQVLSLSYTPHHFIAVWPQTQTIASPNETITLLSDGMKGSLVFEPRSNLAIDRATVESGPLRMSSTAGWDMTAQTAQVSLRQSPAKTLTYDVAVSLAEMTPPKSWTKLVRAAGLPTEELARADLDASVKFDAPWDLSALDTARPQPRQIEIGRGRIKWGELVFQVKGKVTIDSQGRPEGEVTIRATNWQAMLDLAVQSDAMPEELAGILAGGLELMARFSGNGRSIDAPLTIRKGNMTLGGLLPLGEAPRLILR